MSPARARRRRHDGGVAIAEVVITIIPFLLLLFGMMQLALIAVARISVRYAAGRAVRAAVVVLPAHGEADSPATGLAKDNPREAIRDAAAYALIPVVGAPEQTIGAALGAGGDLTLKIASARAATGVILPASGLSPAANEAITTRVVFAYPCRVPLANRFLCNDAGSISADARADLERAQVRAPVGRFIVLRADATLTNQGRQ
jgi:hypothetical protein